MLCVSPFVPLSHGSMCYMSLQHVTILSVDTPLNSDNDHCLSWPLKLVVSVGSNSLRGGACRLEIISAPNDDMLEGDFEFSSRKDFR